MQSYRRAAATALATLAALVGLALPVVVNAAGGSVTVVDFAYRPGTVTVNAGDTVTWTNQDPVDHTVTSEDGAFDVALPAGQSITITFDQPGTFGYFCQPHPDMRGTVVVQAEAEPSAAPTADDLPDVAVPPPAPQIRRLAGLLLLAAALGLAVRHRTRRTG